MYAVVKRLEDDYALCEINSKHLVSIERVYLPREARKGSAFLVDSKITSAIQEIIKRSDNEADSCKIDEPTLAIPKSIMSAAK